MQDILLKGLNDYQIQAIRENKQPLMVVAGAGCGKTTVITRKIAWLISQENIAPQHIVLLQYVSSTHVALVSGKI